MPVNRVLLPRMYVCRGTRVAGKSNVLFVLFCFFPAAKTVLLACASRLYFETLTLLSDVTLGMGLVTGSFSEEIVLKWP